MYVCIDVYALPLYIRTVKVRHFFPTLEALGCFKIKLPGQARPGQLRQMRPVVMDSWRRLDQICLFVPIGNLKITKTDPQIGTVLSLSGTNSHTQAGSGRQS